jgi:predicted outer membrane repeat protein
MSYKGGMDLMRGIPAVIVTGVVAAATISAAGLVGLVPVQAARAGTVRVPCSVRALVLAMTSSSDGEVLNLASNCTYLLTKGLPVISTDLVVLGNGATLSRAYEPGTPAFVLLSSDAAFLTISRLSFRNGDGAITMDGGQLTVNGGTFTRNTGTDGGAISEPVVQGGYNAPAVSNATFIGNRATDSGGAIFDGDSPLGGIQVTNCTFSGNVAANFGGAVYDFATGDSVTGSVFLGNRAGTGGALFLDPAGQAYMSGDKLTGNIAAVNGGAIDSLDSLDLVHSKLSGNRAGGMGGGLYIDPRDFFETAADTEFVGNSAAEGGAIANTGFLELTGVIISGNHASEYGAGIYNVSYFVATNTLITRNAAVWGGGGIYNDVDDENYSTPTLTSSSVLNNNPDNCDPLGSLPGCAG